MPSNITTAVDSLVNLVNDKGKISIDDASRELGIPSNILNEWATFLDQENIIHIEYKFTTPYLTKSADVKKEIRENAERISDTAELVIRRLSATLNFVMKSQPKIDRQKKRRDFLVTKLNGVIESAKKGRMDKEELKKLIYYYKVYKMDLQND